MPPYDAPWLVSCMISMSCLLLASQLLPSHSLIHHHVTRLHLANKRRQDSLLLANQSLWFSQTVDHFNPQAINQVFPQRYYEFTDYFTNPKGPIFLEICGESECFGIWNDYYAVLAKDVGAAIVTLEHRYYGESIPTKDFSIESLKYLTSRQALFDLATFRKYYQDLIIQRYNLTSKYDNPWIVLGGSYSGALSAWFRVLFPHLVRGSISSSGVVNAIENYEAYDIQLGESMGPICGSTYMNITKTLQEGLTKNATYIKSLFNATELNDGDFASFIGTFPASKIQYGDPTDACEPLFEAINSGDDIMETYIAMINSWSGGDVTDFSSDILQSTNVTNGARLWVYQTCTEFGFFATAASKNNVFLRQLDLKYYLDICKKYFGDSSTAAQVDVTNTLYGATKIAGSRILFLNGSQDPYRHASKGTSTPSEESILITCDNCAHCVDINGCQPNYAGGDPRSCSSPGSVYQARKVMRESIKHWISHKYD